MGMGWLVEEALLSLRTHAEGSEDGGDDLVLADVLKKARQGQSFGDLGQIWADLVRCLEIYRTHSSPGGTPEDCFSQEWDSPVQWISKMVTDCLDFFATQDGEWDARHEFLMLGWRIHCAWDAIEAGVVGSLADHVENEAQSRQFID